MTRRDFGLLNKWLRHLKDVYRINRNHIDSIGDPQARWDRLVEMNVTEQVQNPAKTSIVKRAGRLEQRSMLHWVYDLRTGYLKELALIRPNTKIDDIYQFEWDEEDSRETPASCRRAGCP
jgi:carbonic anhydrase